MKIIYREMEVGFLISQASSGSALG